MSGFDSKVSSRYSSVASDSVPPINTSSRSAINKIGVYKAGIAQVISDIRTQTGISTGLSSANLSVFSILPANIKTLVQSGKSTLLFNSTTNPFWVLGATTIYFGGGTKSSGGDENNTPKKQGDLAYDALISQVAYQMGINGGRSATQTDALQTDYNTKKAKIYAS